MMRADIVLSAFNVAILERGGCDNITQRAIGHIIQQRRFEGSKPPHRSATALIPLAQNCYPFPADNFVNDNRSPSANRSGRLPNPA
jgi:hypothetical protein